MKLNILLFSCLLLLLNITNTSAQINADFTASTQEGCNFQQVQFTNTSTIAGTAIDCNATGYSYNWNFNPGGSTQCSPGNIFSQPGSYTICLTVTNNSTGESNTECKTDFIVIHPLPTPSFTITPKVGCSPLQVCFQNTSTINSGTFTSCLWDFGDGTVSTDCSTGQICHTYTQVGDYQVSLTIQDSNGCPPVTTTDSLRVATGPDIAISADVTSSCAPPLSVTYTNNSPITDNIIFTWIFEGAETDTFVGITPPPIVYNTSGTYDVTIISQSPEGCLNQQTLTDYISIEGETEFTVSDYSVCVGEPVTFTNTSNIQGNTYLWHFGDNIGTSNSATSTTYSYNATGCYSVSLSILTDQCNIVKTDTVCIQVSEVPIISFTNDNPIGCSLPHTVNFTSSGGDTSGVYTWNFAGLGTSNEMNPSFTFTNFGTYPVTLSYTSADGCTSSFSENILIEEPQVSLVGSSIDGCVPQTVTLQGSSSSSLPITDWLWTVPNVGTFNEQNPAVTLVDTGSHPIILQITNSLGCVAIDTFYDHIEVGTQQSVDFTAEPPQACLDTAITFHSTTTEYVDQLSWNFGDGGTSQVPHPTHFYSDTGAYQICLTVFQNGCQNTECKPDIVRLLPPKAIFSIEQSCEAPYTYSFISHSIEADSLEWTFGDAATNNDTSSLVNPSYTYSDRGNYTIQLVVHNLATGCTDTTSTNITVSGPLAQATINDTTACAPLTLSPIDASIDAVNWSWTSISGTGNIAGANTSNPTITYSSSGQNSNDIQLIITDVNGCQDTTIVQYDVTVNSITPAFTVSQDSGCVPMLVTFVDSSTNPYANNITYDWSDSAGNTQSGSSTTTTFNYQTAGTYDVSLTVTDDLGCTASTTLSDAVFVTLPTAMFNSDTVACTEQIRQFQNTSTGVGLSYAWDFGDGNTSNLENPSHAFMTEDTFNVCLIVTDVNNCQNQFCRNVVVANPVASFTADTTNPQCPPLIINFTNTSTNAIVGGSIWNFGDNTSSNGDNPAHVYTDPDTFDVSLIVTSLSGCQDTTTIEDYISLSSPSGTFTFDTLEGCSPTTVTFISTSDAPALHIMDYGDGSIDSSANNVLIDTFEYTYTQAGLFTPALILVDAVGCSKIFNADSTIRIEHLEIDFTALDTLLCGGGLNNFSSSITTTDPIQFIEWTFEDATPSTSSLPNPVNIAYNNNGQYDVTLVVDNGLCRDSITKENYITVESPPIASFTTSALQVCQGDPFVFTNNSTATSGVLEGFVWNFGDGTDVDTTNNNPVHTYNNIGTYTVELEVNTEFGCTASTTQEVTVVENPDITVNPTPTICIGSSVDITTQLNTNPAGVTYSWDNANTLSCSDCPNPVASPTQTTTYTVTATLAGINCYDTAQVTVVVLPFNLPNIGLGADTSICEGSTIQLIAAGGAGSPFTYEWNTNASGLSCYDCSNPFASPSANTTYEVTVTGLGNCSATEDITISIFDPSQDFVNQDVVICQGESTTLSHENYGTNPEWQPATGLSCIFCNEPTASPDTTTTYYVYVDAPNNGCRIYDSIVVKVVPSLSLDAGTDTTICAGDLIQLQGVESFGSLSWTPSNTVSNDTIPNPTVSPTQETTYYLTATLGNCTLTDSVTITTVDEITLEVNEPSICIGDSVTLVATGNAQTYFWSPSTDLSATNIATPTFNGTTTTTYTVTGEMGSCPSVSQEVTVTVNPLPEASLLPNYTYYDGSPIQVGVTQNQGAAYNYSWTPSEGLSCSDCHQPTVSPDSTTTYHVLVTDRNTGCQTTVNTTVIRLGACSEDVIAVPNAFTPNGDGQNDVLYVRGSAIDNIRIFRIFDRWGKILFESKNMTSGWNGKYNGKKMNSGVYVYYVEAICPLDGSTILKKGNVTLLR